MTITKRNYLLHTALLTVLIGIVGGWAYFSINPHHYFGGYPLIPLFFFFFWGFIIYINENFPHPGPGRKFEIFLLVRGGGKLGSLVVVVGFLGCGRGGGRAVFF